MPKCKRDYADMRKYRDYMRRGKRAYRERTGSGLYPPRPWTAAEDEAVIAHEVTDRELSERLARSVQAIQVRRARLKKKENEHMSYLYGFEAVDAERVPQYQKYYAAEVIRAFLDGGEECVCKDYGTPKDAARAYMAFRQVVKRWGFPVVLSRCGSCLYIKRG